MELQNIHIQVSIDKDEVACKEEDFGVLSKVTTYCLAWKNEILEEEDLEGPPGSQRPGDLVEYPVLLPRV